jgi:hypothetical protein
MIATVDRLFKTDRSTVETMTAGDTLRVEHESGAVREYPIVRMGGIVTSEIPSRFGKLVRTVEYRVSEHCTYSSTVREH